LGEAYGHTLQGHFKYKFGHNPEYRLIYRIYNCCENPLENEICIQMDTHISPPDCQGLIDFIYIRTREECNLLYKRDRNYFEDTLIDGFDLARY
jgi:hypothetical protein